MNSGAESVHLQLFPNFNNIPLNKSVIEEMEFVRKICSIISSIRKKNSVKARLPLQSVLIVGGKINLNLELQSIIKDESNIKEIHFAENFSDFDIQTVINLDAKKVAKRIGKDFQVILKQAKQGIFTPKGSNIEILGHEIFRDEYEIQLKLNNEDNNYASLEGKYLIILDTKITKSLEMEGIARDFIRAVQNARKESSFEIADKITLKAHFKSESLEKEAIMENQDFIMSQVLANSFQQLSNEGNIAFNESITFKVEKIK
jgi:isoleucyl-tRNA synthetase